MVHAVPRSWVPQGSILGPILCNSFINDLEMRQTAPSLSGPLLRVLLPMLEASTDKVQLLNFTERAVRKRAMRSLTGYLPPTLFTKREKLNVKF